MKLIVGILLITVCSACSTVSGLGKDITNASEWTKDKINGTDLKK